MNGALKHTIERHNTTRLSVSKEKADDEWWKFKRLDETSTELALYYADYKCEACGSENMLTQHHLINRKNKLFIQFEKYVRQRRDFRNTAILCRDCHNKVDSFDPRDDEEQTALDPKYVKRVEKKLGRMTASRGNTMTSKPIYDYAVLDALYKRAPAMFDDWWSVIEEVAPGWEPPE